MDSVLPDNVMIDVRLNKTRLDQAQSPMVLHDAVSAVRKTGHLHEQTGTYKIKNCLKQFKVLPVKPMT